MAGLPQQNPIPGAPLLDPLGQQAAPILPVAPAPMPDGPLGIPLPDRDPLAASLAPEGPPAQYGNEFTPQGDAPQAWPPPHWFNDANAAAEFPRQQLAPEGPPAPVEQAGPPAPVAAPVPEEQMGPPRPSYSDEPTEAALGYGKNAPGASTGDPYLDYVARSGAQKRQADQNLAEAEQDKNENLAREGIRIAQDRDKAQAVADQAYHTAHEEAKARRLKLDAELLDAQNTKIDPNRARDQMPMGKRVAMAITSALIGFTDRSVMSGGKNAMVDQLNSMAEADIDAQKFDIQNRKQAIGMRSGLVNDQMQDDQAMLDMEYKSFNQHYETAKAQLTAESLRWDNPIISAKAEARRIEINDAQVALIQGYESKTRELNYQHGQDAIKNRQEDRKIGIQAGHLALSRQIEADKKLKPPERDVPGEREDREAAAELRKRQIRGANGDTIGLANTEVEERMANQVVTHRGSLTELYKRGRELFKDDWAAPGTKRREQQDSWNANWAQERRMASGDISAPNVRDNEIWGIKTGQMMGDNMDVLDESYNNAVRLGRSVLKHSGVKDEVLNSEGFVLPDESVPTSTIEEVVSYDNEHGYNTQGYGTPLDAKETAAYQQQRDRAAGAADPEEWKYRRQVNNIQATQNEAAVRAGKPPAPLPYPEVGVGRMPQDY